MAEQKESQNVFGQFAGKVDNFFQTKFYAVGLFVGSRPCTSIMLSLGVCLVMMGGISQAKSESRAQKLWIPQNTAAQADQEVYATHFPPTMRVNQLVLEAKGGSVLDKAFLQGAMALHEEIEDVATQDGDLASLCVPLPSDGHPCFISSVLGLWGYNSSVLGADADPLATLNAAGKPRDDLQAMLGGATFSGSGAAVQSAQAMMMTYFLNNNRNEDGQAGYKSSAAEAWEEELLTLLGCDAPACDGDDVCACSYDSAHFRVFARAERSFSDAFGGAIQGDVMLINMAFMIMIVYLILNLGGFLHKIQSRALLAFACTLSIVVAGASGYGISMWMQFVYTPAHGILPFVILGIGVDDSFVIMNAFDRTDPTLPVPKRIATAISHAGVSIMVTSLTDFVAFAISVTSALPALSSFCMYAAFSVLMLFLLQVFFFAALATLDAHRVAAGRIDCCPCLCRRGCPCCPTVPQEEAAAAIGQGRKDPNQLGCTPPAHKGGRIGRFMESTYAPQLVKPAVIIAVVVLFAGFCGVCAWQSSQLAVQDTQRNFIPDDSYVATTLNKMDQYFSNNGDSVDIMTLAGDYHASQSGLASMSTKLDKLDFVKPTTGGSFRSWAEAFKGDCMAGLVPACDAATGQVTGASEYYGALAAWLQGPGARYRGDVVWVDEADPQQGIKASRFSARLVAMNREVGGRIIVDSDRAIEVMDGLREACDSWSDLPGGGATPYTYSFLVWETFRIIKREMFMSVGLCLAAVFVIALALLAHPLTAVLVSLTVVMTVVDILGCMNMWGLAIDNVSVIQLVISVGLCIDYAAHVGHNFMLHQGSRSERVVATLGDVGSAVICGAISTFLGVMLLSMSKSYVFRVLFQTFFLTVILGLGHGMILLPALLAAVGPESYRGAATVVKEIPPGKAAHAEEAGHETMPQPDSLGA